MDVLVFKTSVESADAVRLLKPSLDAMAGAGRWNFALDDCDRILRVQGHAQLKEQTIDLLQIHGFGCKELDDE